ncbi:hypothetical protein [Sphingopyxis terrae]|uniref:hypothetical protein n=1 Tax=Sphingopyxis terrae TaxID=33052 RepID=UPI001C2C624D|nr:hypothetical protein [Sphingopyxis terrae]QXF12287.1 hypothetical protein HBA51_09085 [Sphingopyxis terrae subsp. terrae]
MSGIDLLEDARLLFERAQTHRRHFHDCTGVGDGLLWDIRRTASPDGAVHSADLILDRSVLKQAKPIIADIANNLVHALDHIAAAARRQANTGKAGRLYFPFTLDETDFAQRLAAMTDYIGADWAALFTAARTQHQPYLPLLQRLKTISNEAKHWELRPGMAGANAVQWFAPDHHIVDIPAGHFATEDGFQFWEGPAPFPNIGVMIVTAFRIRDDDAVEVDLEPVLETSATFVAGLIAAAADHLASLAPPG